MNGWGMPFSPGLPNARQSAVFLRHSSVGGGEEEEGRRVPPTMAQQGGRGGSTHCSLTCCLGKASKGNLRGGGGRGRTVSGVSVFEGQAGGRIAALPLLEFELGPAQARTRTRTRARLARTHARTQRRASCANMAWNLLASFEHSFHTTSPDAAAPPPCTTHHDAAQHEEQHDGHPNLRGRGVERHGCDGSGLGECFN